jgi:peptidase E
MKISNKNLQEYREIYLKEYGKEISDDEAREAIHNLVGLFDILIKVDRKEQSRKIKLKDEPNGFHVMDGTYNCGICNRLVSGIDSWYDKYGTKCITCQRAVNNNIIPGKICHNKDLFYTLSDLKYDLKIHSATARKMIRGGKLKERLIKDKNNKPYEHIFLIEENLKTLPNKDFDHMNLILMSSGKFFTEKVPSLINDVTKLKIAYISTASKQVPDDGYAKRHQQRMKDLNFNFEEIDITGKKEDELMEILKKKEMIYVEGGNTFYLLKQIRESGFDKVVRKLVKLGMFYAGSSAGAYVACPTIETATWNDTRHFDRFGITNFTAMHLFPSLIKAHCNSNKKTELKPFIEKSRYNVELLTDDEAIIVKNGEISKINK